MIIYALHFVCSLKLINMLQFTQSDVSSQSTSKHVEEKNYSSNRGLIQYFHFLNLIRERNFVLFSLVFLNLFNSQDLSNVDFVCSFGSSSTCLQSLTCKSRQRQRMRRYILSFTTQCFIVHTHSIHIRHFSVLLFLFSCGVVSSGTNRAFKYK